MQAIGLARLGLSVALVAPIGEDADSELLRAALASEGVHVVSGSSAGRPPTTALLSTPAGVAMATVLGDGEPTANDVREAGARALVLSLGRLDLATPGISCYVVTGGLEVPHVDETALPVLAGARAFVANAAEAARLTLTGAEDPEGAARALARLGTVAVVTLGADGALAVDGDDAVRVPGAPMDAVDATGAGDLFVSAYVWADLRGASLQDRLSWATLYAGLSVRQATAFAGAVRLDELLAEGRSRGLSPP
jgi:sugar/nucleoside kinase (ribokinase family)